MQLEIYTADNLIIVGNLSDRESINHHDKNLEKLRQIWVKKSKSLHITEVMVWKINRELCYEAPFLDLCKSEIVCMRLVADDSELKQ